MIKVIPSWAVSITWPRVDHLLKPALDKAHGETDINQLKWLCINQGAELVTLEGDDGVELACVVEYMKFPNYRVAHVIAIGGRGLLSHPEHVEKFKEWLKCCRDCKILQAWCGDAEARLYRRIGLSKVYNVVRVSL